jgi:hypothetical protein
MKQPMKQLLAATAIAAFGLAPAIGTACEYMDESSASAQPPAQLASTPAPQATKAPQAKAARALAPKTSKQNVAKAKAAAPAPEQKVAAVSGN